MSRPLAFGSYSLLERLGVGARAEVFRAERRGKPGAVALKRVLAGAAHDASTHAVLFEEATLLGRLDHPGIVKALDHGMVSGVPFVVYELVDGSDLGGVATRAREKGVALPVAFVLAVGMQVAEALSYVHGTRDDQSSGGIVHRDIGPSNILVGRDGAVKICDFGIAKVRGRNSTTGVGEIKGTVRYMSPEQVHGQELDARSDLYALGAVMLELLARRPLYEGVRPTSLRLSRIPRCAESYARCSRCDQRSGTIRPHTCSRHYVGSRPHATRLETSSRA